MKYLVLFVMLLPGFALAHGGHAPVPEAFHNTLHVSVTVGVVVALAVTIGFWVRRRR